MICVQCNQFLPNSNRVLQIRANQQKCGKYVCLKNQIDRNHFSFLSISLLISKIIEFVLFSRTTIHSDFQCLLVSVIISPSFVCSVDISLENNDELSLIAALRPFWCSIQISKKIMKMVKIELFSFTESRKHSLS